MFEDIKKIYEYREMLKNMVKKELRARYKGSVLGFFWTFVNPLLQLAVYATVFSTIVRMQIPGHSYTLFLFVGLIPWNFFGATLGQSTTVVISNGNLVKKIFFPRLILPLSIVLTNFVNFVLTLIIVLITLWFNGYSITPLYLLLPFILVVHFLIVQGFAMILSSITVYFRDLEHIMSIVLMAWVYFTPIFYNIDYIPNSLYRFMKLNPMFFIVDSYRRILMFNQMPDINGFLYVTVFSLLLIMTGYYIFSKIQKRFAEEL